MGNELSVQQMATDFEQNRKGVAARRALQSAVDERVCAEVQLAATLRFTRTLHVLPGHDITDNYMEWLAEFADVELQTRCQQLVEYPSSMVSGRMTAFLPRAWGRSRLAAQGTHGTRQMEEAMDVLAGEQEYRDIRRWYEAAGPEWCTLLCQATRCMRLGQYARAYTLLSSNEILTEQADAHTAALQCQWTALYSTDTDLQWSCRDLMLGFYKMMLGQPPVGYYRRFLHTMASDGSRTLVHRMVTVMNACQLLAVAKLLHARLAADIIMDADAAAVLARLAVRVSRSSVQWKKRKGRSRVMIAKVTLWPRHARMLNLWWREPLSRERGLEEAEEEEASAVTLMEERTQEFAASVSAAVAHVYRAWEPTLCATRSVPLKNVIGRVLRAQKRWSEVTNREAQAALANVECGIRPGSAARRLVSATERTCLEAVVAEVCEQYALRASVAVGKPPQSGQAGRGKRKKGKGKKRR